MAEKTMKAVIFDGPHKVSVQDRPVPKRESHLGGPSCLLEAYCMLRWALVNFHFEFFSAFANFITCPVQHGGDIIVKVQAAALCGSYVDSYT